MRLPPHVIRRRQGLYLRLPADRTRLTRQRYIVRTLGTSDARLARGRAATVSAQVHGAIERARAEMAGTFLGKPISELTGDDIRRIRDNPGAATAALEALSPADNARLAERLDAIIRVSEAEVEAQREGNRVTRVLVDLANEAQQRGVIEGLKQAIASGGAAAKPRAHAEAASLWTTFTERFLVSRGELSDGTPKTYRQFERDLESAIGIKDLADLTPRDIAKYGEWLEKKASNRGAGGG